MKKTRYSLNDINKQIKESPEDLVKSSENYYNGQLDEAVEGVIENTRGRRLVMLAGPSGSGKTTTAKFLSERFIKRGFESIVISLDDFYKGRDEAPRNEEGEFDFETVHALNIEEMTKCLNNIVTKGCCEAPIFDFMTGKPKKEKKAVKIAESGVVIVEGLHALNPIVVDRLPKESVYKIYISVGGTVRNEADEHIISRRGNRLCRRMIRDSKYRNCEPAETLCMWNEVEAGENKYLFPFENTVDYSIDSFHPYELGILKNEVYPLLKTIPTNAENYDRIERLIEGFKKLEGMSLDYLPKSSLLMEFLG